MSPALGVIPPSLNALHNSMLFAPPFAIVEGTVEIRLEEAKENRYL